jgi:hypothetical protein
MSSPTRYEDQAALGDPGTRTGVDAAQAASSTADTMERLDRFIMGRDDARTGFRRRASSGGIILSRLRESDLNGILLDTDSARVYSSSVRMVHDVRMGAVVRWGEPRDVR